MLGGACCNTCIIGEDDFSANDGKPHSGWTNRPAIYSTASGDEATNASGVFTFAKPNVQKFNTAHPDGASGKFEVEARFKLTQIGSDDVEAEIIVGYLDDTTFLRASVLYEDSGCSYLLLSGLDGGAATGDNLITKNPDDNIAPPQVKIPNLTLDTWHTLKVCLIPNTYGTYGDGDTIRAHLILADGKHYGVQMIAQSFTGGAYVGLGNSNAHTAGSTYGSVSFDDFKFQYFRETSTHASCPNCNTPCFIGSDDFETDYTMDVGGGLGCFWHVLNASGGGLTGTSTITGGYLECQVNSIARYVNPHPQSKTSKIITVTFLWEASKQVRVDTGSGYAIFDSTTGARRIRLYDNDGNLLDSSAVDSLPVADDTLHTAEVCYVGGALTVTIDGVCLDAVSPDTGDVFCYLGSTSGTVKFATFDFKKHKDTSEPKDDGCGDCEACASDCDTICIEPLPQLFFVTPFDIAVGDGTGNGGTDYCCAYPLTDTDGNDLNGMTNLVEYGSSSLCPSFGDPNCCFWTATGDGTAIWNGSDHPGPLTGPNQPARSEAGQDPCGTDFYQSGPDTFVVRFRVICLQFCPNGEVTARVQVWVDAGIGLDFNIAVVDFTGNLEGDSDPYDCESQWPLRLDYSGDAGITGTCTGTQVFDFSNAYVLVEPAA